MKENRCHQTSGRGNLLSTSDRGNFTCREASAPATFRLEAVNWPLLVHTLPNFKKERRSFNAGTRKLHGYQTAILKLCASIVMSPGMISDFMHFIGSFIRITLTLQLHKYVC